MKDWLKNAVHMPSRISAVACVTFTQLVRMKLFLVLAVFSIIFLGLQFIPYQGELGAEYRGLQQLQLIKDISMGSMQLFALVFCVGATSLLIPRDSEDRILYTILCKPVPRFDYLAGKALGVMSLLLVMMLFMDALVSLLLHVREEMLIRQMYDILSARGVPAEEGLAYEEQIRQAGNTLGLQMGIWASFLGYCVLTSLTLLFSCITSGTIVSMIFSLGAWFVGMFQGQLLHAFSTAESGGLTSGMQTAGNVLAVLLPDFGLFMVSDATNNGTELTIGMLGSLGLIALGYVLLHLLVSTWLFNNKEF